MCLHAHQHGLARLLRAATGGDRINADLHFGGGAAGFTGHLNRHRTLGIGHKAHLPLYPLRRSDPEALALLSGNGGSSQTVSSLMAAPGRITNNACKAEWWADGKSLKPVSQLLISAIALVERSLISCHKQLQPAIHSARLKFPGGI